MTTKKSKQNTDKAFQKDLALGQKIEQRILSVIQKKYPCSVLIPGKFKEYDIFIPENNLKVEVKVDYKSQETGNILIELFMFGKPSALLSTKADYWVYVLATGKQDYCKLVFDVSKLKQIVERFKDNYRMIGDYNKSKCILIPLAELFKNVERSKQ